MLNHTLRNMLTPTDVALQLNYREGTVKNKCAHDEFLCKKIGKQWILDSSYLKPTKPIELWEGYNGVIYYIDPIKEIKNSFLPIINRPVYFAKNKEFLIKKYGKEHGSITLDDVPWSLIQQDVDFVFEGWFTDDYANQHGYLTMQEYEYSYFRSWVFAKEGVRSTVLHDSNMRSIHRHVISKAFVSLDGWSGKEHMTRHVGLRQEAYRVLKSDGEFDMDKFIVVEWSDIEWNAPIIKFEGTLDEAVQYIATLNDGADRNWSLDTYKELLDLL